MDELPRKILCDLIAKYGQTLAHDPLRCESLLKDLCGDCRREIFAIVCAMREGAPSQLQASTGSQLPFDVLLAKLSKQLSVNLGLEEHVARWAICTWALALGVTDTVQERLPNNPNNDEPKQAEGSSKLFGRLLRGLIALAALAFFAGVLLYLKQPAPSKGSLEIMSDPSGATFSIDGHPSGATPGVIGDVEKGMHSLSIGKEGHETQNQTVFIEPGGMQRIVVRLIALPPPLAKTCSLEVASQPSSSAWYLDHRHMGQTPGETKGIEPGFHTIRVVKEGFEENLQSVNMKPGDTHRVTVALRPIQSAQRPPKHPGPDTVTDATTGIEFVWVPGGCFQMGCGNWARECRPDEDPAHEVCVDDYWMGRYEVTQGQWNKVMSKNPSHFKNGDNYPVEQVSWNEAAKFIDRLNSLSSKGFRYRLPSEAEWEYAARSGGKAENSAGGGGVELGRPNRVLSGTRFLARTCEWHKGQTS
jgi:hypothetical protein